jgi:hypothetical protein
MYEVIVKKVENKIVLQRKSVVLTPNISAKKSEEGPLPYCKTKAESEAFNHQLGPLVSKLQTTNILHNRKVVILKSSYATVIILCVITSVNLIVVNH